MKCLVLIVRFNYSPSTLKFQVLFEISLWGRCVLGILLALFVMIRSLLEEVNQTMDSQGNWKN